MEREREREKRERERERERESHGSDWGLGIIIVFQPVNFDLILRPWSVWFYFLFTIFNSLSLWLWILAVTWKRSSISAVHTLTSSLKASRPNFIKTYRLNHYLNVLKRGILQRHLETVRKRLVCSKGFGQCFRWINSFTILTIYRATKDLYKSHPRSSLWLLNMWFMSSKSCRSPFCSQYLYSTHTFWFKI